MKNVQCYISGCDFNCNAEMIDIPPLFKLSNDNGVTCLKLHCNWRTFVRKFVALSPLASKPLSIFGVNSSGVAFGIHCKLPCKSRTRCTRKRI